MVRTRFLGRLEPFNGVGDSSNLYRCTQGGLTKTVRLMYRRHADERCLRPVTVIQSGCRGADSAAAAHPRRSLAQATFHPLRDPQPSGTLPSMRSATSANALVSPFLIFFAV